MNTALWLGRERCVHINAPASPVLAIGCVASHC